jgi:hypothetical protein
MIGAPEYISLRVDISDFKTAVSGGHTDAPFRLYFKNESLVKYKVLKNPTPPTYGDG